ncbi:unnamed protein product [Cylicostephanus goldi]|uniref:Uncharacterized protein n=1 Tax=Cylicostephanus goldi TaxID=71465 RepID=A0A3P6SY11_CYLGO|nr:unnamed protein product [Cylicostephanus goldi]
MRISPAIMKAPKRLSHSLRMSSTKALTVKNINPQVVTMQYAVRGPIVIRAVEIEKELAMLKIISMHSGCQQTFQKCDQSKYWGCSCYGTKAHQFVRQVLSCVSNPSLMETGKFPTDVIEHSKAVLKGCGGHSTGAYSESTGVEIIRRHIAEYITV